MMEALVTMAQVTSIAIQKILFAHINRGKEGKPHGTKPSLKNGHGAGPTTNNIKLPSFTHPK